MSKPSSPDALANPIVATTADDEATTANHADSWEMEVVPGLV